MIIRRAKRNDLKAINQLRNQYGMPSIDKSHINHRDVAIVAQDGPLIVGYMWAGLMRQNKMAYIDNVVVSRDYAKQGTVPKMYQYALEIGQKIGVQEIFGIIAKGDFFERAAYNALRTAVGSDGKEYVQVRAHLPTILKELRGLNNGR